MMISINAGTNIPARFERVMFSDYDVDRGRVSVAKKIRQWEPTADRPGLLLVGSPGLAKTLLACATLNEFQSAALTPSMQKRSLVIRQALLQQRFPVYFIQMAEWIQAQIRCFQLQQDVKTGIRGPDEYVALDTLLQDLMDRVKMLVIDDVGKEHRTSSAFAEDAFELLVRTRFNSGLPTVFTSNMHLREWGSTYSDSMRSFIERNCAMIEFRSFHGTG